MVVKNSCYDIVYASDDGFAEVMGISILSLLQNNKEAENIRLTILDSGISVNNKNKVEEVCKIYHRALPRWVKATNIEKRLEMSVSTDRGSVAQYARIFLSDVFSSDIKRVLYLDCDTLIVKSIYDLWNLDLEGNTIAALKDAFSKYYRKNINLDPNDIMFNSGVILIDLDKWRENNVEKSLLSFIEKKHGKIQQGDQGALNAVLSKSTKVLNPKFNMLSIFYELSYRDMIVYRRPVLFYSESEILSGKKDMVIIHYTSSFNSLRPWVKGSNHSMKSLWLSYKLKSPWRSMPFRDDKRSKINKLLHAIYNMFPKIFALYIASFFQVLVRPLKNRI